MAHEVTKSAPGKINLYFAVGDVREDGYHPVASLYSAVSLIERVTVSESDSPGIVQSVSIAEDSPLAQMKMRGLFDLASVPLDSSNLAYRAAEAVLAAQGLSADDVSVNIHLEKAVPVAGGMGGGSADAAATLLAMNEYTVISGLAERELTQNQLLKLAVPLGADVPFALLGGLAVGLGVGDQLTPVDLPANAERLHLVMVLAPFGLSTPAVFAELDRGRAVDDYLASGELAVPTELISTLQSADKTVKRLRKVSEYLRNDLGRPACTLAPDLLNVLAIEEDQTVVSAFVSGSGPTVALLMESAKAAQRLESELNQRGLFAVAVQTST